MFAIRRAKYVVAFLLIVAGGSCQPTRDTTLSSHLLFCGGQAVYSVRVGSTAEEQVSKILELPEDATCPTWSPNGSLALLYRFRNIGLRLEDSLSLIERQSGTIQEIYRFEPRDVEWIARWLPDGISLLLLTARDYRGDQGNRNCEQFARSFNGTHCWNAYAGIYVADIQIGDTQASFQQIKSALEVPICELAWSPNGDRVAYVRGPGCLAAARASGIDVLELETQIASTLVADVVNGVLQSNSTPRWSPEGNRILLTALYMPEHAPWSSSLLEVDIASGETRVITTKDVQSNWHWSPDGKKIAWLAVRDAVGITDVESGKSREWTISKDYNAALTSSHSWSPDGRYFVWTQWDLDSDKRAIFILDPSLDQILTLSGFTANSWAWSPDSDWLAFSVLTQIESNTCKHRIDVYIVRPDGSDLRHMTEGLQLTALQCSPEGWGGYRLEPNDVQWVPR